MGSRIQVLMFRFKWVRVWDLRFQATFSALSSVVWQQNRMNWVEGGRHRGSQIQTLSFTSTGFALLPWVFSGDCRSPLSRLHPSSIQISSFPRTEKNAAWQCRPVSFIKFATMVFFFFFLFPVFSSFFSPHFFPFWKFLLISSCFLCK